MMKQFYERALPPCGIYCASGIDPSGKITNRFAGTLEDLYKVIEDFTQRELNVFVAPGSFHNFSRKAENSHSLRSFFIDLDVGKGKGYDSKDHALAALQGFVVEVGLPPPVRIDSGTGIHAYWIFEDGVPYAEWKPYAEKFKSLCKQHLKIDPVVTADAARIMRCPESLNYKTTPPNETFIIDPEIHQYSFDMFKEFLGPADTALTAILESVPRGLDDDTKKLLKIDNFESVFGIIAQKSIDDESGCKQIEFALKFASVLSEPMWHSTLSIARHCVDWEDSIQELSKPYPKYDPEETLRKANETLGKPHSCSTFDERNPGICKDCPHRGKITNPLALGKQLKVVVPEQPVEEAPPPAAPTRVFPDFLKPFVRGAHGGIYYMPPVITTKDGKQYQDDPILLSPHDVFPVKRMFSPIEGECLLMNFVLPNDPVREFTLPMKSVYSQDEFCKVMTSNGVLFNPSVVKHFISYVIKWGQYLINAASAEQMRMQMGWTENYDAFVIGKTEITDKGKSRKAASSPMVNSVAKLLKPVGDYALWQEAANALDAPGFELHAFATLCAFGSPLMRLTSTHGVAVCYTGESGGAKTGALFAGMSVMGDPYELTLTGTRQTTDNGMVGWYLNLHSILFGFDEASNKHANEISELVHRIAQGKAKIRMQASVNAVRELEQSASLIAIITSNQSLYDKLTTLKKSPDGEVARLVEFSVRKPQPMIDDPDCGKRIFDVFRTNYGHAGPAFIKHYFKRGETYVRNLLGEWADRFVKDFGNDSTYRFYENLVSAAMTGGQLANEAGIVHYDLDKIYRAVVIEMISIRDNTVKINGVDYKALIGEFIHQHHAGFLILNEDRVMSEPRGNVGLVGRIEVHNQMQYISKTEFKKYLSELQVSGREFEFAMQSEGILVETGKKKRLSSGWKAGMNTPPVIVYGFKTDLPEELLHG